MPTTEGKMRSVRHIPEAELHAYLDQALSRSQCVEIERHLADCMACQSHRDGIAALRDQTTALLARIGPPLILPPPYASLQARFAERSRLRRRWIVNGARAASIAGAVALGWALNGDSAKAPPSAAGTHATLTVLPASSQGRDLAREVTIPTATAMITPHSHRPRLMRVERRGTEPAATWGFSHAVETDPSALSPVRSLAPVTMQVAMEASDFSAQPVSAPPELSGLWRTVIPDSIPGARGSDLPLVPGLTVLQMRVQPGQGAEDGEVTAVDQVLESGEMIRTIAGPASRVGTLVDDPAQNSDGRLRGDGRVTVTIRQGDRMVAVTGPSDALGSLLSRVNTRRRY